MEAAIHLFELQRFVVSVPGPVKTYDVTVPEIRQKRVHRNRLREELARSRSRYLIHMRM